MAMKKGSQSVEVVLGRHVVCSAGDGKANVEEIKWLTETVLNSTKAWKTSGWGYIPDCTKMDPVTPDVGNELVEMTKKFVENGCKAIAFVDGASVMLKVQAQSNTKRSNTGLEENHFATKEEALAWLKERSL